MFCGDVMVSDGTGGLISMVWNSFFQGPCWFHLCIQLCSCWLGISSGRLYQFYVHLELDLLDAWKRIDQVNKLQEHLNLIDPHIKFTIELPGIDGLPFLDTLTKPTPNSIESTVYRKTTNTDWYYKSNHPISAKLSVIHTLTHRAKQVCSTPELLAKEMDHLHKVLQDNHYPPQFF